MAVDHKRGPLYPGQHRKGTAGLVPESNRTIKRCVLELSVIETTPGG